MEMSTPGKQFAVLVRRMRDAQKKATSDITRARARELEKQVDEVIRKLNLPADGDPQAKMFN